MHSDPPAPPVARPLAAIDEDIHCPLCNYNLRGLTQPRCPECGFTFEWPDLLDPARRKHPYLFEHHPDRNIWSFTKTLVGSQSPRRFWTTLHPAQPSNRRRLFIYVLLTTLPVVLLFTAHIVNNSLGLIAANAANRAWLTASLMNPRTPAQKSWADSLVVKHPTTQAAIDSVYPPRIPITHLVVAAIATGGDALIVTLLVLVYPLLTLAALLVFQISMKRAKVRTTHVARCWAYSFDVVLPWSLIATPLVALESFIFPTTPWIQRSDLFPWLLALWFGLALFAACRLAVAYHRYLRFDRPYWTVLATQIIAVLAVLNVLLIGRWF